MYTSKILTDEEIEAQWSCYSEDDIYPEEDLPYSTIEEAEVAEENLSTSEVMLFTHSFSDRETINTLVYEPFDPQREEGHPARPLELIAHVIQSTALGMMRQLQVEGHDSEMPIVIELSESAILDDNTIGLFLATLSAEMKESWAITVIWNKLDSISDCFNVMPVTVDDIVSGKFYSLDDMRTDEVVIH